MTTYAPNGTNLNTESTITFSSGKSPNRYHLTRILRKRGMRGVSEILKTLLDDSTPASNASVATSQINSVATPGGTNSQGGVRTVTSNETMNSALIRSVSGTPNTVRAVSATDVTELQKDLEGGSNGVRKPSSYPIDASGNGGGGKLS